MKERLINVLKWFLMILGVIFLIQFLIGLGIIFGLVGFANADLDFINTDKRLKPIQPIIDYVEEYKEENGKYPDKLGDIKLKKDLDYKYEVTKDGNCYTITVKSKKENMTKQYQYCSMDKDSATSRSESYVEYSNN